MKDNDLTTQTIGLALQEAGLHPYVKGRPNHFGVYRGGDDYEVLTDRLPELYIRKEVMQYLFDWREEKQILAQATNMFNARPSLVRAIIGYDTMAFVLNVEIVSMEHFSERILHWLDLIEQALDQFRQACATVVRYWEQDELVKMEKELLNPSQDNPWLMGQIAS